MWVDIIIFLKVAVKIIIKKKTTKNPQNTIMELTGEQWKWSPTKVYLVVMLEIIKLLTSVIDI